MGRRGRKRNAEPKLPPVEYADPDGNVLALKATMTAGTRAAYLDLAPAGAQSIEDAWQRRAEFLFERLAARWVIAGLPALSGQKELLARYRMASPSERQWIRETLERHVTECFPELAGARRGG